MHIHAAADPGPEWDAFVEATPGAALGHAAAWAVVLREAYGLAPSYLAAREGGELAGVLPLARFRTLAGRLQLVSLPYLDTGGVLAASEEAERALLEAALAEATRSGARAVELRQAAPLESVAAGPGILNRVDLVLELEPDEERQWKAFRAKVRNQTRKAEREGLRVIGGSGEGLIGDFYGPFRVNMRDLGSPVHSRRFFEAAARAFGERLRVIVTYLGSRPVGGLVAIRCGDTVTVPWASTLRSERRRCPNNLIYWEALRWAIAGGARRFDFGRSPQGSGTYRFKKGWGAEERPLAWLRLAPDGEPLATGGIEPHATLAALSRCWTRLPLPIADLLGPPIRRFLSN